MNRILLIDDCMTDAARFMQMLAQDGYLVEHVRSLADGFERSKKRSFDAVLLELNLPDSQGIATLQAARRQLPALPIVVLTDLDNDNTAAAAYFHDAQDYLIKSKVTPQWLGQSVKHAMVRVRALSQTEAIASEPEAPAVHSQQLWSQESIDDVIVLRILPRRLMDASVILSLEERLASLVDTGKHHLVVSLENVEYISNAALGVLIGTLKKIRGKNGTLHLAGAQKNVRNQLGSRQFHRLFQIYDDVASAVASIAAIPGA